MNIGQERAEFEVWRRKHYDYDDLTAFEIKFAFAAFQAGRAALQSPEVQARQWQPIETAPKDFVTEFDGWNGKRVPNVIWAHPEYGAKGEYAWCRPFYEPNHGWTMERVRGLTHWMPLPAPPSTT